MYGNKLPAEPDTPKTWPEWTDVLGNTYRPGDNVAISIINGKSPQMVIGEVLKINRVNSSKQQLGEFVYDDGDPELKEAKEKIHDQTFRDRYSDDRLVREDAWQKIRDADAKWQASRVKSFKPSCTVRVQPSIDSRGFWRYGDKPVTYQIPENIIKVDVSKVPLAEG